MTGSADNGSCAIVSFTSHSSNTTAVGMIATADSSTATGRVHLRKTALGASSPAKPALHIPELVTVSSSSSSHCTDSSAWSWVFRLAAAVGAGEAVPDNPTAGGQFEIRGIIIPIVNDEGCDFFCNAED
jgi:hypothetical protein